MEIAARLVENRPLGRGSFVLALDGCQALSGAQPGQFVMLRGRWGRDPLLPRAFSILRTRGDVCEILVKAVGRGTRLLQQAPVGAELRVLGPLGRAFPIPDGEWRGDYLVAGGVGLAPLLWFAERTRDRATHEILYGARTAADLVLLDEVRAATPHVILTTEDGSMGRKGRVTDALAEILPRRSAPGTRVLTCGPNAMMRTVVALAHAHIAGRADPKPLQCIVSVEGEMACGIGACLGCAIASAPGQERAFRYACVDGPVFDARDIVLP